MSSEPDYYSGKRLHLIHASFSSTKPIFQINIFSVDGLALLQTSNFGNIFEKYRIKL